MKNVVQKSVAGLVSQARTAASALAAKAETLGLVHLTAAVFTMHIDELVLAREEYDVARTALEADRNALKEQAKALRRFARVAREALKPFFGEDFNAVVAGAGFDGSFEIPRNHARLIEMVQKLQSYMIANPSHENPTLEVTALRAGELATGMETLIASVAAKTALVRTKKEKSR